jgi:hypothetical protein
LLKFINVVKLYENALNVVTIGSVFDLEICCSANGSVHESSVHTFVTCERDSCFYAEMKLFLEPIRSDDVILNFSVSNINLGCLSAAESIVSSASKLFSLPSCRSMALFTALHIAVVEDEINEDSLPST